MNKLKLPRGDIRKVEHKCSDNKKKLSSTFKIENSEVNLVVV